MQLIRKGSRGTEVMAIQRFLLGGGYDVGPDDGIFGGRTHGAVVAYQRAKGLVPDGIVGNRTLGAMLADGLVLMPTPDNAAPGIFPPGFPARPEFSPLTSNVARQGVFGRYRYVSAPQAGNAEAIRILDGWEAENIVLVQIPQLRALGLSSTGNARMHRLVVAQTLALWQAWEDGGLLGHVRSWHGMFVARYIRGSRVTLSNHAFGSAFDINYSGNTLGSTPAAVGSTDSVRELVPLAHEHGFYWGGHFSRSDGMHFEVAKVKP